MPIMLALAGCGGDPPAADEGLEADAMPSAVEPPVWEVGQYWEYTGEIGDFTLVVSDASGDTYRTDTDSQDLARFDVLNDPVFLGPLARSDLAGYQDGQKVRLFEWPLRDQASWSTIWHGEERDITAAARSDGTFLMTGTVDGTKVVEYVYDPEIAWIDSMSFFDNGTRRAGIDVTGAGTAFSGELQRWSIDAAVLDAEWEGAGVGTASFDVPENATLLSYRASLQCADTTAGAQRLQMGRGERAADADALILMEQDPPVDVEVSCPGGESTGGELEARQGPWVVRAVPASDGGAIELTVDLWSVHRITLS